MQMRTCKKAEHSKFKGLALVETTSFFTIEKSPNTFTRGRYHIYAVCVFTKHYSVRFKYCPILTLEEAITHAL